MAWTIQLEAVRICELTARLVGAKLGAVLTRMSAEVPPMGDVRERELNALVYKLYGLTEEEIGVVERRLNRE